MGFPVTTPGVVYPVCIEYVSMIHAMTWAFVPMSGAGMSPRSPTTRLISVAKRLVSFSSSRLLSFFVSTLTEPFAPPYGMFATAHFHVIHMASAVVSLTSTSG